MRPTHVTPAIVLRSWPFGESDKIVSFLTQYHGKLRGIAKGAKRSKKRFGNSLEPFSLVNLRFQERTANGLAFVVACDLQRSFHKLAQSLDRIAYASYCVEITEGLIGERDENRLVFDLLNYALGQLEAEGASLAFLATFELKLLQLSGYQPVLDSCRRCGTNRSSGRDLPWHFSLRDGGILCAVCSKLRREILPLPGNTLDVMTDLQQGKGRSGDGALPAGVLKDIRSVILRFIQFHMDREIKSAPFLHTFSIA